MANRKRWHEYRAEMHRQYDVERDFDALEESCIPSYLHKNTLAAWLSWRRLTIAVSHFERFAPGGPVLDFGAGSGVLAELLPPTVEYGFVEAHALLAKNISKTRPGSKRYELSALPQSAFAAVFALDSLEHNDDVTRILKTLSVCLKPNGVMIVSGPTENSAYRFGRWLAGFDGHYHVKTIYDIERELALLFHREGLTRLPLPLAPLFRISTWRQA